MSKYSLQVQMSARWKLVAEIEAPSHKEAFRKAMGLIKPEHYDKPIRLEKSEHNPPAT